LLYCTAFQVLTIKRSKEGRKMEGRKEGRKEGLALLHSFSGADH
jgi:hypothetical protein